MPKKPFVSILLISLCMALAAALCLAAPAAPTRFNTYDGLPPGGRSLSMGYAAAALSGSPDAVHFNPAGLHSISGSMITLSYEAARQSDLTPDQVFSSEMLRNKNLVNLGLVAQGTAFSWRPLADATNHEVSGPDYRDTEIKVNAYTLSSSNKSGENFSLGLGVSYLSGRIAQSGIVSGVPFANIADGNGVSVDLGFLYEPASSPISLGLNLQNLFGMMWWDDFESEQLPFTGRAGFAFKASDYLTFAADYEKRFYRKEADALGQMHFGIEQRIGEILQVRLGTYGSDLNDKDASHITAGLGYRTKGYELDLSGEKYRVSSNDVYRYLFSLNIPLKQ